MMFSEIIPRRNSCQILQIERKKTNFSNNWKKNHIHSTIPKHIYVIFSLINSKLYFFLNFYIITVPFGFRVTLKKTCTIVQNRLKINKKNIIKRITKKKIGKIFSKDNFRKKIKSVRFWDQIKKKLFFFLEKKKKKKKMVLYSLGFSFFRLCNETRPYLKNRTPSSASKTSKKNQSGS
mmetsp:Transcript_33152/g.81415  ORF Transcript_33152/g.81415 Transcript_33152/m.81415 type:complete len:178 (+) Transcript_33152:1108-1641(+)